MADVVALFREAIGADLAVRFPDAEIHYGNRTGRATDRARIAILWSGSSETGEVIVGEVRYLIRYWPITAKLRDDAPAGVRDPAELEAAAYALQSYLQTKQTGYPTTGAWYSRLLRVTPDYDPEEWGVEAELLVVCNNPAVVTA